MRIAQVAPPWLPVPSAGYGGTEHVVSTLTEELVRRGHDVTLFASGDSKTSAKLSSVYPNALGNDIDVKMNPLVMLPHIYEAFRRRGEFDIIHVHDLPEAAFLADLTGSTNVVHTIHRSIDDVAKYRDRREIYLKFRSQPYISISNAQRRILPDLHWIQTAHNGINPADFVFGKERGSYLLWLGRITPKKGVVEAIRMAKAVGMPIKVAAYVDHGEQDYFETQVKPMIDGDRVIFLGELQGSERARLLSEAFAVLFPIRWNEPFGLVMVEAMASGTPVIAPRRGSVPEIVVDNETGFTVPVDRETVADGDEDPSEQAMTDALRRLLKLPLPDYLAMRDHAHARSADFTISAMTDAYEAAYRMVTG